MILGTKNKPIFCCMFRLAYGTDLLLLTIFRSMLLSVLLSTVCNTFAISVSSHVLSSPVAESPICSLYWAGKPSQVCGVPHSLFEGTSQVTSEAQQKFRQKVEAIVYLNVRANNGTVGQLLNARASIQEIDYFQMDAILT
jgi:hypothetical protein